MCHCAGWVWVVIAFVIAVPAAVIGGLLFKVPSLLEYCMLGCHNCVGGFAVLPRLSSTTATEAGACVAAAFFFPSRLDLALSTGPACAGQQAGARTESGTRGFYAIGIGIVVRRRIAGTN
jgi:hypothetical protein